MVEKDFFYSRRPHIFNQEGGITMAISESQRKAVAKYNAANYDRVELRLPKGKKQELKDHAEGRGETLNGFVNRAIEEALERDNGSK